MRYAEHAPSPRLAPWVRCYWTFEADAEPGGAAPETIAPDGCPELIFHVGDPFQRLDDRGRPTTQHRTVLVGQIDRAMTVRPMGRRAIFAVRFRPAGAAAFFGGSALETAGRSIALADVWGRGAGEVAERIAEARDDAGRVAAAERALLGRFVPTPAARLGAAAADRIVESGGALRIADLAADLGTSPRTLERAFDATVGLAPKTLARIVRFRRALALLQSPGRPAFSAAAHDCGYADQSHLVRDFRSFTGAPPTEYLRDERPMADHFV